MLSNKYVEKNDASPSGYRAVLVYEFDTDQVVRMNIRTALEHEAAELLNSKESEVVASIKKKNAAKAYDEGVTSAYLEASESDVKYYYLEKGYNQAEPYLAYLDMSRVADDILNLGLSVEQMAAQFGTSVEIAQAVIDKWDHLKSNEGAILAYMAI